MKAVVLIIAFAALLLPTGLARAQSARADDPHAQLEQILHRPMYQAWRLRQEGKLPTVDIEPPFSLRRWIKRMLQPLRDFIRWLFRSRSSGPSAASVSEVLPTFLKVLAGVVLLAGVIFLAVLVFNRMNRSAGAVGEARVLSRQQVKAALDSGDALAMGSAMWLDEARRLAMEQDFRAVYRALYLALISGLHRAGKIEHNRNHTNWMYVRSYRGPAEERATFGELTALFDRVWYGHHAADEGADLEQLQRQVITLTGTGGIGGAG